MTDALPADRALNRDELDAVACEWSDYRKDYGQDPDPDVNRKMHHAFGEGWGSRHLHGYTPDPKARLTPGVKLAARPVDNDTSRWISMARVILANIKVNDEPAIDFIDRMLIALPSPNIGGE